MRLVCISDTHLKQDFQVPDGDILVHSGDCMNSGKLLEELRTFLYWFKNLPHKHKVFIAGNHDWVFDPGWNTPKRLMAMDMVRDAKADGVTYLQDEEADIEGLRIYGSPWQPEFFGWAFNLPRFGEQLRRRWDAIPTGLDVLLTHGPPHGVLDAATNPYDLSDERAGCEILWERVLAARPKVHVFGHIHTGYGKLALNETLFVNASVCDHRYRPWNAPHVIDL